MKVTECLNTEHGVFLTQLELLENMVKNGSSDDELRAVTLAIAKAVEKHRDAEEEIFYPMILKEFGSDFAPIQVMESEHKEIERFIKSIDAKDGNVSESVSGFISILREHIAKEIKVLFPMAEEKIPADKLEQMACQCVEFHHKLSGVSPCGHGEGSPCAHDKESK